jgi:hypothetical protein
LSGRVTIGAVGRLAEVAEFENSEDPLGYGGLTIEDLSPGGQSYNTDENMVSLVLEKVGIPFGDIAGTGVIFNAFTGDIKADAFMWAAGDNPAGLNWDQSAGESALRYIQRWDQVSAVHPGPFADAGATAGNSVGWSTGQTGFFRTFETLSGTIRRVLIGGRPRGTPTISTPFIEGVDIREPSEITRGYPKANRFQVLGFDDGGKLGPTRFTMQSSNDFMGSRKFTGPVVSSPMIERSAENDPGNGMSCEKVAYALEPEYNRITVSGSITTGRDDYISHGATIIVQGPSGVGRLGTNEHLWVQSIRGFVSFQQGFTQTIEVLGGGLPDDYLPAVPQ